MYIKRNGLKLKTRTYKNEYIQLSDIQTHVLIKWKKLDKQACFTLIKKPLVLCFIMALFMAIKWYFHFSYLFISLQSFSSFQSGRLPSFQFSNFFSANYSWIIIIRYATEICAYILFKWQLSKSDITQQNTLWWPHHKDQHWWNFVLTFLLSFVYYWSWNLRT